MAFYSQCKKGKEVILNHVIITKETLYFTSLELCTFLKAEAHEKYEISGL